MAEDRRYWAFVSHSHVDLRWAVWVQRSLERFTAPRGLAGGAAGPLPPTRLRPIFRDRDEFVAGGDLRRQTRRALERSRYLIVVCSPHATRSPWVNTEIEDFRALGGADRILAVIVDGAPNALAAGRPAEEECFPPALRGGPGPDGAPAPEPIAADLRPGRDGRRLALLKLAAALLEVDLDDLAHRDAHRRQQQMAVVAAASFAGMLAMGALAAVAVSERNEARRQRAEAEGLIEFMLVDLRKTLEPTGRLDALDAVGQRAMKYYAAQPAGGMDADSLGRRSRVQHLIGDLRDQQGDLTAALSVFREAATSTSELLKRRPDDPRRIFDHAQSVYWVGYIAWRRGQSDEATRRFLEYKALADRLVAIDPRNDAWRAEVGYANSNLGTVLLEDGKAEAAAAAFGRSLAIKQALAARKPMDRDLQSDLGQAYGWRANAELLEGDAAAAMADRRVERRIYQELLARRPGDMQTAKDLAANRQAVANILVQQGRLRDAIAELAPTAREAERMLSANPDATDLQMEAATASFSLGQARLQEGDLAGAQAASARSLALAEGLVRRDPSVIAWQGGQLGSARALEMKVQAATARTPEALATALAPARTEFHRLGLLWKARPRDVPLARAAAECAVLAGDSAWMAGHRDEARTIWREGADILVGAGMDAPSHRMDRGARLLKIVRGRFSEGPGRDAKATGLHIGDQSYTW
jgi:tetratricopeptide (TPR) repeat protein